MPQAPDATTNAYLIGATHGKEKSRSEDSLPSPKTPAPPAIASMNSGDYALAREAREASKK
jgi:hypothetical protein